MKPRSQVAFERFLSSDEAGRAYLTSPLFHAVAHALRHALDRGEEDAIAVLGRLCAQITDSQQEWIDIATKRAMWEIGPSPLLPSA